MKIRDVQPYAATVTLDGDELRALAEACELASHENADPQSAYIETLGAAFQALAIAAYSAYVMPPQAENELKQLLGD